MPNGRNGKYTLVLDSSQIATYLECPTLWYYQYYKHLVPSTKPSREAMDAGTYGHRLLDIYYKERALGSSLNDAAHKALSYDPDNDTCECGCSIEHHKYIAILNFTECQRCRKCHNFTARKFDLKEEIRQTVRDRVRDYIGCYSSNDFIPLSDKHVEVGFSEVIFEDSKNLFVLEGRIDLIATLQGMKCTVDHKYQIRSHQLYGKTIQFKNYALVSKNIMFVVNYIRLHKAFSTKDTLVRDIITFTVPELLEWKKRLIEIYFRIKGSQLSNTYQQNWSACAGKYGQPCWYTGLCEEINKDMLGIKESSLFQIETNVWRPW